MTKSEFRKNMIALSKAAEGPSPTEVADRICSLEQYKEAKLVLAYIPLKSEVDVTEVLDRAAQQGKTIGIPTEKPGVFALGGKDWRKRLTKLNNHTYTLESSKMLTFKDERSIIDKGIILVPGLAFTEFGTRLGRGAGYYDQTLLMLTKRTNKTDLFSIGICKCAQLVTTLPTEPHDMTVNVVLAF